MSALKPLLRRQAGDTIVEVLIALAVLGLALGISYATANRSLQGARQAQEHTEALQLLQSQMEQLRANATQPDLFDATQYTSGFCFNGGGIVDMGSPGANCNLGSNGLYKIVVTHQGGDNNTFLAEATWDAVTGRGKDKVSMVYRLYQP